MHPLALVWCEVCEDSERHNAVTTTPSVQIVEVVELRCHNGKKSKRDEVMVVEVHAAGGSSNDRYITPSKIARRSFRHIRRWPAPTSWAGATHGLELAHRGERASCYSCSFS